MNTKILIVILLFPLPSALWAQQINYYFSAPNAVHHEAIINILAKDIGTAPAVFRMSRSSPGRYATHEFGKNVYDVRAEDGRGHPLTVVKTDGDVYAVPEHTGTVRLTYTLYGNYADGTYSCIDASNYHLNMPATFMWLKGFDNAPITIHFDLPAKWKIATQLAQGKDAYTFTAPGLQLFMDAPVKMGRLLFSEWQESNPGKQFTFRLALDADATQSQTDSLAGKLKKITETARDIFGEYPDYDFGAYTFITSINPYVHGDGMEHRNSTMITTGADFNDITTLPGVFSHEFFHCWNVERIRPKTLEPFNFEKSNMSDGLWLAEGFTLYYGDLIMVRAGFLSTKDFAGKMTRLINAKENRPGGRYYSPIENSQCAVFTDAGVAVDKTNYPNTFSSYYTYGGAIALALDLELRSRFNKTLDDLMRGLWVRFGKTETAYTMEGVREVLAGITNDKYAARFFEQYIFGHRSFNYKPLLEQVGYSLQQQGAGRAWIGDVSDTPGNEHVKINGNTVRNTPLYEAGLDINDVIMKLDGRAIKRPADVANILLAHKPGDVLQITYGHRAITKRTAIITTENPELTVAAIEENGKPITNGQVARRAQWLGR